MQQWERWRRRPERLAGQVQQRAHYRLEDDFDCLELQRVV